MATHAEWSAQRLEHWSTQAVLTGFSQVLDTMRLDPDAEPISFEVVAAEEDAELQWTAALWREARGNLAPDAVVGLGCSVETLQALAQQVLGAAPSTPDEAREIYSELLNQSLSVLSGEATGNLGRTVEMGSAEPGERPSDAVEPVEIRFSVGGETFGIVLAPNAAWVDAVLGGAQPEERAEAEVSDDEAGGDEGGQAILDAIAAQSSAAAAPSASTAASSTPSVDPDMLRNLERLMDIDMEIAISFGETTLMLADVLKLSSGAIVELNRAVSDSVELLVNDSVIAQGEVVVVEGNYGIRVTHVVSAQERVNLI